MLSNNTEIHLHESLHKSTQGHMCLDEYFNKSRLKLFPYIEKILNKKISGSILDLGAGNGYAGIWLAKNRKANVTSLECTIESTTSIIPYYADSAGVTNTVNIKQGSFNDLSEYKDKFDYIVCFGVLHHSSNLLHVVDNIFRSLKPGGILIAQEPCTDNHMSNLTFMDIYNSEESFSGKLIRHGDRDDHFYRECEYHTAIHHSGLELVESGDVSDIIKSNNIYRNIKEALSIFYRKLIKKQSAKIKQSIETFPEKRSRLLQPKHLLLICQKPTDNTPPPHRWCSTPQT